jgi:hypothetical protein
MREIVEYKMLHGPTCASVTAQVNEHLKKGYQPFGSPIAVVASENNRAHEYCQAMVRYVAISSVKTD